MNLVKKAGAGAVRAIYGIRAWLAVFCLGVTGSACATDTLTMTATMLQGSCNISFTQGETTSGTPITSTLTLPAAKSEDMTTACSAGGTSCLDVNNVTPVTVSLTGCGLGQAGTTPAVSVTGPGIQPADALGPTGGPAYLFRDGGANGGTSVGYGIALGRAQSMNWSDSGLYRVGDDITLTNAAAGSSGEGAYGTLWLVVSCGVGCDDAGLRAGSLNANLQFSFRYK
ncbi:hypothetical protein QNZ47_000767 [Enterobacter cloacae]|nr:hypothetical protein [Enterobacter cloacae]